MMMNEGKIENICERKMVRVYKQGGNRSLSNAIDALMVFDGLASRVMHRTMIHRQLRESHLDAVGQLC